MEPSSTESGFGGTGSEFPREAEDHAGRLRGSSDNFTLSSE